MQNKFAWISTPDELWEDKKEMITTALESGIDHVLDFDDIEEIRKLGNVKIIANNDDADIYLVGINGEGDGFVELKEDFKDSTDIANAKKAKSEGLTQTEKEEQAILRSEYIEAYKKSLVSALENTYIVDEKGNKTKIEKKKRK